MPFGGAKIRFFPLKHKDIKIILPTSHIPTKVETRPVATGLATGYEGFCNTIKENAARGAIKLKPVIRLLCANDRFGINKTKDNINSTPMVCPIKKWSIVWQIIQSYHNSLI